MFLSRNYRLIVAPRKFDVLKTNICPRSEASRTNMLVLKTSNFQGATIIPTVPRHKHSIVFNCPPLNFLPPASSNCFSRIFTKIYFKQRFPIISRRTIKLCALKRSLGLNYHSKLKLCARAQETVNGHRLAFSGICPVASKFSSNILEK